MSRPNLLFLAVHGELIVYDLTKAPPRPDEDLNTGDRVINVARSISEVQTRLAEYHRERIETGVVFGQERFRNSLNRADRACTHKGLEDRTPATRGHYDSTWGGTPHPLSSSLADRPLYFCAYLEDREILTPKYFESIAARRQSWRKILSEAPSEPGLEPGMTDVRFLRVLQDKEFTYALFKELANDFNGDSFPLTDGEQECIRQEHIHALRGFLTGTTSGQQHLFFFAYRFDIIPIELISTIYEEFYNERTDDDSNQGAHYTDPTLVEFVLFNTLTPEVLAKRPRIIDPSCGSGIFLVESFRRIVRHLTAEQGKRVSRPQLRRILREQIAGIDINKEAIHVAAFSLYLAFLHYQEPREINAERRLPHLKLASENERQRRERANPGAEFFDILLEQNAFVAIADCEKRFGLGGFDVVVGNPPWATRSHKMHWVGRHLRIEWCKPMLGRPIGDKELSQAFIHLTIALLREGGHAGLLVSSGVLFKQHSNSQQFREVWLKSAQLRLVVNFSHVRHVYFSGPDREAKGISPFL